MPLPARQREALRLLRGGASDGAAAAAVGVRRETVWRWRHRNPDFAAEMAERADWREQLARFDAAQAKGRAVYKARRAIAALGGIVRNPKARPRDVIKAVELLLRVAEFLPPKRS